MKKGVPAKIVRKIAKTLERTLHNHSFCGKSDNIKPATEICDTRIKNKKTLKSRLIQK